MINVEELLKPIAEGKPCGEDFSYHDSFQKLETLAQGKPEQVMGTSTIPAEEPKWKDVQEAAIELLKQSKHLRAAFILTRALLKTGGAEGLRDGLAVVRGITEKYWPDLYPKLDPADNNDPTERLNILNNLSGSKFGLEIQQIILCNSPTLGRVTLQQYLTAKDAEAAPAAGGAKAGMDLNQINAAFRDSDPVALKALLGFVTEAIGHTEGVDKFLDTKLGAGQGVNFEALKKLLGRMKEAVESHSAAAVPAAVPAESAGTPGADAGAPRPAPKVETGISGTVQTRAHVLQAIKLVCDYYGKNEPSSPVPLLLQRAQALVDKDFMAIIKDLNPEAIARLQVITGVKPENKPPG